MWNKPTNDLSKLKYTRIAGFEIAVHDCGFGLEIYIKGYGHQAMKDGEGAPIFIVLENDDPIVYINDNINDEEPTYRIDLAGAQECLRADFVEEDYIADVIANHDAMEGR